MPDSNPETHVIDYRAAEQLLAARDPRGAVKLLDSVIAAHPENTAARLLRARAFFAAAQLRPAELEFELVLEREPDNAFAHFGLARTLQRAAARNTPGGTSGWPPRSTRSPSTWRRRASTPWTDPAAPRPGAPPLRRVPAAAPPPLRTAGLVRGTSGPGW